MAVALLWLIAPARAADPIRDTPRAVERSRPALPVRGPVGRAVQTLGRLRLHPGQDAFDPRETVRQRPAREE